MVRRLHQRGIALMGCFVFGFDHDTTDTFAETAEFAIEAHIDLPRFAILTPFPGTPLFDRLKAEGRILTEDWGLYDGQHVVFRPRLMSPQELLRGTERAWKTTYSYRSIARRLWGARLQLPVAIPANLGYRFYAHRLHRYYTCDWAFTGRPAGALPECALMHPKAMRLTLIHPCVGRRAGEPYIRSWQMEPLAPAVLAGLTPPGRAGPLLRRPPGAGALRRAGGPGGAERGDVHRQALLPDRLGVPPAGGAGGAGRVPPHPRPGGGQRVRGGDRGGGGGGGVAGGAGRRRGGHGCGGCTGRRPGRPCADCARTAPSSPASATCPSGWWRRGGAATSAASSAPCRPTSAAPRPGARRRRSWTRSARCSAWGAS